MRELVYPRVGLIAIQEPAVVVPRDLHLRRLQRPQRHHATLPVALDLSEGVPIETEVALKRLAKLE